MTASWAFSAARSVSTYPVAVSSLASCRRISSSCPPIVSSESRTRVRPNSFGTSSSASRRRRSSSSNRDQHTSSNAARASASRTRSSPCLTCREISSRIRRESRALNDGPARPSKALASRRSASPAACIAGSLARAEDVARASTEMAIGLDRGQQCARVDGLEPRVRRSPSSPVRRRPAPRSSARSACLREPARWRRVRGRPPRHRRGPGGPQYRTAARPASVRSAHRSGPRPLRAGVDSGPKSSGRLLCTSEHRRPVAVRSVNALAVSGTRRARGVPAAGAPNQCLTMTCRTTL